MWGATISRIAQIGFPVGFLLETNGQSIGQLGESNDIFKVWANDLAYLFLKAGVVWVTLRQNIYTHNMHIYKCIYIYTLYILYIYLYIYIHTYTHTHYIHKTCPAFLVAGLGGPKARMVQGRDRPCDRGEQGQGAPLETWGIPHRFFTLWLCNIAMENGP